jgi:hypothetical protein
MRSRSNENDSNLILSSYIDSIDNTEIMKPLGDIEPVYIGDNRFIDRARAFSNNRILLSKPQDYASIVSFIAEKNNIKDSIDNVSNTKNVDKNEEMDLYYEYNNIIEQLNNLIKSDISDKDLSLMTNPDKENLLNKKIFILIWSNDKLRNVIESKIGFNLKDFSLAEQAQIINFLKTSNNYNSNSIKNFSEKYKRDGLRTFLSVEQGGEEMRTKILVLGEKLPEESADILFKTYGEMIDAADEVSDLLKTNLKEKATPELIEQTKRSLLVAGKDLLERYADKAETCEGDACTQIGKELEERLALAQKSVFAFSYACKVLVEKGEFSFEDFEKAKLSYDQSPLPLEMAEKIIKMHHENTKQYPESLRDLWRGTLKDGLTNSNPDQLIVSASYEDEVVSAMRVIKRADGSWYGASFNVNPTVQGSKIGTELLKEVLKGLAKDKPFVADCYSGNPMLKTYLDKFGFKITKEIENYHDTGELVYEITIFPEDKKEI